jgi:hypothetical protein
MFSSGRSLIRALARRACPASRMAPLGSPAGFGLASRPGRRAGAVEEKLDVEGRARLSTVRIWHPKIVASRDQKPHHRRVLRDRGWRRLRQHGRRGNGCARNWSLRASVRAPFCRHGKIEVGCLVPHFAAPSQGWIGGSAVRFREGRRARSAPAERRGDVGQDRFDDVRIVGDPKLVWDC